MTIMIFEGIGEWQCIQDWFSFFNLDARILVLLFCQLSWFGLYDVCFHITIPACKITFCFALVHLSAKYFKWLTHKHDK